MKRKAPDTKPFCVVTAGKTTVFETALKAERDAAAERVKSNALGWKTAAANGLNFIEPVYAPDQLAELVKVNVTHSRCLVVKARDVAGSGFRIEYDGPPETENPETRQRLTAALRAMAPALPETLFRFLYDVETFGFGALEFGRDTSGAVRSVYHLPAATVRLCAEPDGVPRRVVQVVGSRRAFFKIAGGAADSLALNRKTGEFETVRAPVPEADRASAVFFFSEYDAGGGYGVPAYSAAIGTLAADFSRREYNRLFFANNGIPSFAVFITGNYDPGEPDAAGVTPLEKSIQTHFATIAENPHSALVLSVPTRGGAENKVEVRFEKLSAEIKDASFREYRKDNRDEILTAHGVDPYRVGIAETGALGGTTAEASADVYRESTIAPRRSWLESVISRFVLSCIIAGDAAPGWTYRIDGGLEGKKGGNEDTAKGLFSAGIITLNEARERCGFQPADTPDGDRHFVNGKPLDETEYRIDAVEKSLSDIRAALGQGSADAQA